MSPEASHHCYKYTVSWCLGLHTHAATFPVQTGGWHTWLPGPGKIQAARRPSALRHPEAWRGDICAPVGSLWSYVRQWVPCGQKGSGSQSRAEAFPRPPVAGQRVQEGPEPLFRASCVLFWNHLLQFLNSVDTACIHPILQMEKLKLRESQQLAKTTTS